MVVVGACEEMVWLVRWCRPARYLAPMTASLLAHCIDRRARDKGGRKGERVQWGDVPPTPTRRRAEAW